MRLDDKWISFSSSSFLTSDCVVCIIFSAWKGLSQQVISESSPTLCFLLSIIVSFFLSQVNHYLQRVASHPSFAHTLHPIPQLSIMFIFLTHSTMCIFKNLTICFGSNLSIILCDSQEQEPCLTCVQHVVRPNSHTPQLPRTGLFCVSLPGMIVNKTLIYSHKSLSLDNELHVSSW